MLLRQVEKASIKKAVPEHGHQNLLEILLKLFWGQLKQYQHSFTGFKKS